ncbi:MAG: leucyl aminopeptidase, partial [Chlamydiota bacterium]|nr:leucyl aminopeptidase [Chlamydiota bacterium]
ERLQKIAVIIDPFLDENYSAQDIVEAFAEGVRLGSFMDGRFKSSQKEIHQFVEELVLLYRNKKHTREIDNTIKNVQIICDAVFHTQKLVSAPSNYLTPKLMAKDAAEMARKYHMRSHIYGRAALEKMKMGGILSVARGSAEEPQLIVLDYGRTTEPVDFCIVGKGITFDSGGISIKPGEGMDRMKYDMAGGGVVIGVLEAVSRLRFPLRVVGIIAASENMPSGTATKPGDIIRMASGKYVEVLNTDAEGRMVLADVLHYVKRFKPRAVIDLATLTGACIVALGHHASGMMGNDSALLDELRAAAGQTGESVWELPLWDVYEEQIKSDLADIKNVAKGGAGTITAGMFLKQFVDYPWAHLDIAGVAWHESAHSYCPKGPTGFGVRLLVQLMKNHCLKNKR